MQHMGAFTHFGVCKAQDIQMSVYIMQSCADFYLYGSYSLTKLKKKLLSGRLSMLTIDYTKNGL